MRTTLRRTTLVVAAALLTGAVAAPATAGATGGYRGGDSSHSDGRGGSGDGLRAVGLAQDGRTLVAFRTSGARDAQQLGKVSLQGDTRLVGIDYRVQNGKLYGVGDKGGIYVLDAAKAGATKVGQLSVALEGQFFGVDFNPAANALRVVSNTGQNLRQPFAGATNPDAPNGATVVDGDLAYPATTAGGMPTPATGVSAAAYTNNDLNADTSTVLHDIDTALDQLDIQSPANAGTLAAVGKLGVDAGPDAGFDIYSTVRDGRSVAVQGFATLTVGGQSRLYSINLATGQAAERGAFQVPVTDLAIGLNQL
ncbi:DUF4394 domain-containing protein [Geodermatophilus sp. DSM 44513]|uniref:DUF4394 domain-containing protein n=1 Tax=Geodermatophilus sp. DSM 44513 TaxID=1528104 RepID=UPI001274553C|nr:DUF4394 domain-containing protein [Geodermatophilus sp. DSM 44513]WNV76268.1 DUF4394 domain-containing protein [Geodermatophilus sp. DSM 44513]